MQRDQRVGLDLPLRVLVWQDGAGAVSVGYWHPDRLLEDHDMAAHPVVRRRAPRRDRVPS